MSRRVLACLLLIASGLLSGGRASRAAASDDPDCQAAISAATERHHLPDHLLQAIARTESGRYDPRSGIRTSWPWTVTARGTGRFFATEQDAAAYVRALWADGITSIDVGCLQVNLHYHPAAFGTLEQAFDPEANADYAAAFLVTLHRPRTDWSEAIADYHSADPAEGGSYLQRVMLNLSGSVPASRPPDLLNAALITQVPMRFGMTVITPASAALPSRHRFPRIITP